MSELFKDNIISNNEKDQLIFNLGDKINIDGQEGIIIDIKFGQLTSSSIYKIKLSSGKVIYRYQNEVKEMKESMSIKDLNSKIDKLFESSQKNEDFKNPKTHDEIKPGEWYEVEGTLYQIADRQPIDNEIQAFRVFPDYSVGDGVHVLYKSFFKPDKFNFVNKKDKITKIIKEKEAQIAKFKQEIDRLKKLIMKSENKRKLSENIINDKLQKGDDVKVFGRHGKVVKIRGDVVDIEFPADDQNMARSDSYYKQEVQKV